MSALKPWPRGAAWLPAAAAAWPRSSTTAGPEDLSDRAILAGLADAILGLLADPARARRNGRKGSRAHQCGLLIRRHRPLAGSQLPSCDRAGPPSALLRGRLDDAPHLSVVLCTHNPRRAVLEETLAALRRRQPLDDGGWELIIIDNASTTPLDGSIDLSGFEGARIVREERLGLTQARLRGLAEGVGRDPGVRR